MSFLPLFQNLRSEKDITQDLREAISSISSILGEDIIPDTVLHHIFKNHCIGK